MDKALEARIKNQEECKIAVRKANYNASFLSTVGSGKGKIFIDLALELFNAGKIKNVLYLCDNRRLRDSEKDGFPAELEKWGTPEFKDAVSLQCYQTTYKWTGIEFDLVIGDEVDYALTPSYVKFFQNNSWKYIILASGTLTPEKKKILVVIAPIVFKLSMDDAEDKGVVNRTEYYVYNFKMSEAESKVYESLTKKISSLMRAEVGFEDPDMRFWLRKRKHFLNALESSYLNCRKILNFIYQRDKNNRVVIFCELTEQANRCCKYSFHGKNEGEDNLTKFQNGEINALSVVSKIQRGINLKKAEIAIFESMSGSTTKFEQKAGRMKRLGIDEVAQVIFMVPWYLKTSPIKNPRPNTTVTPPTWKATVVKGWIEKATGNISNIDLKILKL
jgi:superfamily II DNA or RNA helicase